MGGVANSGIAIHGVGARTNAEWERERRSRERVTTPLGYKRAIGFRQYDSGAPEPGVTSFCVGIFCGTKCELTYSLNLLTLEITGSG
jgi:hypothetical protein